MTTIQSDYKVKTMSQNESTSDAVQKALGKEDFLMLLATELKNQDPLSPMDNKDFITQMAQFTSLEIMNNVADAIENLQVEISQLSQQSLLVQGSALIGKHISGTDDEGNVVEGVVESITWNDGNLEVEVGDVKLKLNQITQVSP